MAKAVFLDRDGTLNTDPGYISDPAQLILIPGVGEALKRLESLGYLRIIISNQSGVNRGLITPDQLVRVQEHLSGELAKHGASITDSGLCTHRPDEGCACRKPSPKLTRELAERHHVELSRSFFVGDRESDLEAGARAGCRASILVLTGEGTETLHTLVQRGHPPTYVARDLSHAVEIIEGIEATESGGGRSPGRSE